ncbi:type II toxin-antitoxin system RelB/DinJ family antitoxin [soil metagenome]|jgi:DNA-damage-inducible protein J
MPKTARIQARIDPELKGDAEAVLRELGLSPTAAIALFYHQVARQRALPLELHVPNDVTVAALREAEGGDLPRYDSVDTLFDEIDADLDA